MLESDGDVWFQGKCVRTKYKQVQNNSMPPIYKRKSLLVIVSIIPTSPYRIIWHALVETPVGVIFNSIDIVKKKSCNMTKMLIVVEDAGAIFMLKSERTGNNTYAFQTWS